MVLCGSARFYDEFQEANYRLTMEGSIVLSVGFFPHAGAGHVDYAVIARGAGIGRTYSFADFADWQAGAATALSATTVSR